jgi:methyl-accepting chemotaxis protein
MLRDIAGQFERTVGEVVTGVVAASSQLQSTSKLMAATAEDASQVLTSATSLEAQAATLRSQVQGFLTRVRAG